jgi:DNA-binding NarL/FixJ family response regulator
MSHRVLVVDDHSQWRQYLCSMLQQASAEWNVVGQASDGLEAVRLAEALEPDVVLMDVGLPLLDGIEATRQILMQRPGTKVLFLSLHTSWEVATAALRVGGHGYVIKSDAASELLAGLSAIANGEQFLSARLTGGPAEPPDQVVRRLRKAHRHEVGFYADDASLLKEYVVFTADALRAGNVVVVAVDAARQHKIQADLEALGLDVNRTIQEGRLRPVSVAETMSKFMINGWPNAARFRTAWGSFIDEVARSARGAAPPRISACGDCSASLWLDGRGAAAAEAERLWDAFSREHDIDMLCGYPLTVPGLPDDSDVFRQICSAHSMVRSS